MKILIGATLGIAISFATTGAAVSQDYTLRMARLGLPLSNYTDVTNDIPEAISDATGGRVKVETYDSLIPANQFHSAIRDGRIDIAAMVNVYLSSEEPRVTLSNLPGLVETVDNYRILHDGFWGDLMESVWNERYNGTSLADGVWEPQVVISKKPIHKIEDFKGLKVRVHNTEVAFLINALGAKSTPIPAAEMLPALDRGVVDAVITSPAVAYGLGFSDVATNIQLWPFATRAGWSILFSRDSLAKLPEDLQQQIRTAMADLETKYYDNYDQNVAKILDLWKAKGVELYVVPDEEGRKALADQYTQASYDAWKARLAEMNVDGKEILSEARATLGR